MTICVIYRRYSSDEQGKGQGQTLATQLEACTDYARKKGWTVSEVLTDDGYSAFKGEHLKPGAQLYEFVQRLAGGEIAPGTILLAYNPSRLSRLEPDRIMAWVYTTLTSQGFGLAFANKDKVFKANPTIEEHIGMVLAFQQTYGESADKSENVRRAKAKMWERAERREGKWTNLAARPPLWLARTPACDGWDKDDDRVRIINLVYQWSADGLGSTVIAQRLNNMGEKPWGKWRKTAGWGRTAIRQLLTNPAVEGDFVPEKGMFIGRRLTDFYPRIVDADLVMRARAQQKARKKAPKKRAATGTANLFAGLTHCGGCGKAAFMTSHSKKGRTYTYLRCEASGDGRCENNAYYPYAKFEEAALDLCLDLALDDRFFEASGDLREARNRHAELEKLIADRRARRKQIMLNFDADDAEAKELAADLKAEIGALAEQLAEAQIDIEKASGRVGAVEHLRRVNDIRVAAASEDGLVRQQARAKLRQAFSAIINQVSIERAPSGEKVFTVSFKGGILGLRIDTRGRLVGSVDSALGQPLWEFLPAGQRETLEPLIRRIQDVDVVRKLRERTLEPRD